MGIVVYFLHVDADQFAALRERPAVVQDIARNPRLKNAEIVDVDKDWQVLSWLVSPKKRNEQAHTANRVRCYSQIIAFLYEHHAFSWC